MEVNTESVANQFLLVLSKACTNKEDLRNDYLVNACLFPGVTPFSFLSECIPVHFLYRQWLDCMQSSCYCRVPD